MAEKFTGVPGSTVPLSETVEAFRRITDGDSVTSLFSEQNSNF